MVLKSLINSRKRRGYEDVEGGKLKFCVCSRALKNRRKSRPWLHEPGLLALQKTWHLS